ncbi:Ig-like domain-containing protein [Aestuariispira ectoiniformans]|uniref:Ig-like domain-containing protein n=1 Tax=Aestuariispira ectoiniformans TaxID=2775080 RepID=UPI00223B5BE6|nr:Ig-like domain-containing protein [Aestuariispira ectoiniformans]
MNRTVVIGIIGVVIVAIALGLNFLLTNDLPKPVADTQDESVQTAPAQTADTSSSAKPEAVQKEMTASDGEKKNQDTPEFDVVRVSEEGDTVIAGRAPAGSKVTVMDGDKAIGTVKADERGEWVILPSEPLPSGNRELSVTAETPEGKKTQSKDIVVLVVPEEGKDVAGRKTDEPTQPLALLVPRNGEGATRVLQKPREENGVSDATGGLFLDTVDYDDKGNITFGGRGIEGADIQIYLNNNLVGRAVVAEDGSWSMTPKEPVVPGVYTLRVDQVAGGEMLGRIELPFNRAEPFTDFAGDAFIIVQPGNSLWRIARRTLGEGFQYTVIYEANKEQIRDPDLIYPGQVFEIPAN